MKALDEYFPVVVFTLLLNRVQWRNCISPVQLLHIKSIKYDHYIETTISKWPGFQIPTGRCTSSGCPVSSMENGKSLSCRSSCSTGTRPLSGAWGQPGLPPVTTVNAWIVMGAGSLYRIWPYNERKWLKKCEFFRKERLFNPWTSLNFPQIICLALTLLNLPLCVFLGRKPDVLCHLN